VRVCTFIVMSLVLDRPRFSPWRVDQVERTLANLAVESGGQVVAGSNPCQPDWEIRVIDSCGIPFIRGIEADPGLQYGFCFIISHVAVNIDRDVIPPVNDSEAGALAPASLSLGPRKEERLRPHRQARGLRQ